MSQMKMFLFVATLLTFLVVIAASSDVATTTSMDMTSDSRELQTNTIINAACNFVTRILPGDLLCDCAITVGFIFVCSFQTQICLGPEGTGYCSVPSLQGDIRLLRRTIAFEFCLNDATNGGDPAPGLCFDIGGELSDDDANTFNVAKQVADRSKAVVQFTKAVNSKFSSLLKSYVPSVPEQAPSRLLDCVGMSDDENRIQCHSCQLCNNNTGYTFDCTNINELFIQSTCTPLSILTNLRDPDQNVQFFPNFDGF